MGERHPVGGARRLVSVKAKSPRWSLAPNSTIQYTICARIARSRICESRAGRSPRVGSEQTWNNGPVASTPRNPQRHCRDSAKRRCEAGKGLARTTAFVLEQPWSSGSSLAHATALSRSVSNTSSTVSKLEPPSCTMEPEGSVKNSLPMGGRQWMVNVARQRAMEGGGTRRRCDATEEGRVCRVRVVMDVPRTC